MIDRRTVTLLAWILRKPRMSSRSITAPSLLTVRSPWCTVSAVPAGTPVLSGPGRPVTGGCGAGAGADEVDGEAVGAVVADLDGDGDGARVGARVGAREGIG